MYGIEKARHQNLKLMHTSPKSYAVVIDNVVSANIGQRQALYRDLDTAIGRKQLMWMVRKGDLILSEGNTAVEKAFTYVFRSTQQRRFEIPVYEYPDEDDDVPDRWETGQHGMFETSIHLIKQSGLT